MSNFNKGYMMGFDAGENNTIVSALRTSEEGMFQSGLQKCDTRTDLTRAIDRLASAIETYNSIQMLKDLSLLKRIRRDE